MILSRFLFVSKEPGHTGPALFISSKSDSFCGDLFDAKHGTIESNFLDQFVLFGTDHSSVKRRSNKW